MSKKPSQDEVQANMKNAERRPNDELASPSKMEFKPSQDEVQAYMKNTEKRPNEEIEVGIQEQQGSMTSKDPLISKTDPLAQGFFEGILRPCLAEFVGVTLFVFVGTMSVHGTQGNAVGVALTHGLAITFLVVATGGISGGHLNPCVTLGALLAGACAPLTAALYFISQLLGGCLGAALTRGVLSDSVFKLINGGAHALGPKSSVSQGLLCEVMCTAILVTVVLMTAVDEETKSPLAGLCIGVAVTVGIMASFLISGGGMNPARSFGPAVAMSSLDPAVWDNHWLYWLGPALGAVMAVLWYRLFLAGARKRFF